MLSLIKSDVYFDLLIEFHMLCAEDFVAPTLIIEIVTVL